MTTEMSGLVEVNKYIAIQPCFQSFHRFLERLHALSLFLGSMYGCELNFEIPDSKCCML